MIAGCDRRLGASRRRECWDSREPAPMRGPTGPCSAGMLFQVLPRHGSRRGRHRAGLRARLRQRVCCDSRRRRRCYRRSGRRIALFVASANAAETYPGGAAIAGFEDPVVNVTEIELFRFAGNCCKSARISAVMVRWSATDLLRGRRGNCDEKRGDRASGPDSLGLPGKRVGAYFIRDNGSPAT